MEKKLPAYLVEVGLREAGDGTPFDAAAFRALLQDRLTAVAVEADAGYPENEDLFIDPKTGAPTLNRRKADAQRPSAKRLEQEIRSRMPERSLLRILARTAYWIEWWRRFGPASDNDPKLKDPFGRYVITTFVNGTNMGPYEAARHIAGVSGHELSSRYVHIDALFGESGQNVIDWDLIENHFKDLMRVAISVREGAISSTLLLRRLRSGSKRNAHYTAFRGEYATHELDTEPEAYEPHLDVDFTKLGEQDQEQAA